MRMMLPKWKRLLKLDGPTETKRTTLPLWNATKRQLHSQAQALADVSSGVDHFSLEGTQRRSRAKTMLPRRRQKTLEAAPGHVHVHA